jgi:carbamoyl-phosphate synthase small subunit
MQVEPKSMQVAKLALEDGTVYVGLAFGARGTTAGEVVFNTSMTGYQEIITDPSYCGQIITMTYPEIGNYGFNDEDLERDRPALAGFVVRNASPVASNYRSLGLLEEFLQRHGIIGISDIDTRALVRKIRTVGALRGVISTEILDDAELVQRARTSPSLVGRDLVREVIPTTGSSWKGLLHDLWDYSGERQGTELGPADEPNAALHVVALDFGMKWNIARHLASQGFRVTILPGTSTAAEVLAFNPDGVFLSNGPGDPEPLTYAIDTIRQLLGKIPIFGICLGHQLLGLACGAKTFKLKFGHRGANQPVLNLETNRVEITSQNHGFSVSDEGLPADLIVTHRNLNDDTIAGFRHREFPAFSVQYHPEASAGPHDSQYLFDRFRELVQQAAAV